MNSLKFYVILLSLLTLAIITLAQEHNRYLGHGCQNATTSTLNSTYRANLNLLLSSLASNATPNNTIGFYNTSLGQNTDRVYGLFICRGDLSSTTVCQSCVTFATKDIVQRCPIGIASIVYYDACHLRYSNVNIFFRVDDQSLRVNLSNTQSITTEPQRFNNLVGATVNDLADRAANAPPEKGGVSTVLIIAIVIPIAVSIALLSMCLCFRRRARKIRDYVPENDDPERQGLLDWSRRGYMSPEYAMHGRFSVKSDVYSFGVLILEIITGKKNSSFYQTGGAVDLVSYVWKHWRDGTPLEVLDPTLTDTYSRNEVIRCIHIGLLCVQEDPAIRPAMATIVLTFNSYSVTLPSPQEPAFFFHSTITDEVNISSKEFLLEDSKSKSVVYSVDEDSITEVYPR
ncbi:hypothetical protein POTOM_016695 [Populus tomentosa]|uniref:Gnk2-homologous domain-containing protein n=1 Tax=Populus tomentosa TaxID=118781 RepID=A0A8X8D3I0_POPTO|nr:hypothetical protein POTOM_016695 [Populus tomentosa]